jgi:hypothetical protein
MAPILNETKLIKANEYEDFRQNKNNEIRSENWINEYCLINYTDKEKKYEIKSLVQYAAIITSRGRIKLYKAIEELIKNNGRILYCDTDGIFTSFKKNEKIEKKNFKIIN